MQEYKFNINNFDLIRLFAAFQVAFHHSSWHLKIDHSEWLVADFMSLFPGVPIFFFISGFLISKSYENNSVIHQYTQNRALRIFPGLIVCGVVSVLTIVFSGYLNSVDVKFSYLIFWVLSQITIFQFYDPDFLSGYGIGQANGSLWTVFVEMQFYILIPLLYKILDYIGNKEKSCNIILIAMTAIFLFIHQLYYYLDRTDVVTRLLGMSFAPYFYMFLIGVIFQKNFGIAYKYLSGRFLILISIYIAVYLLLKGMFTLSMGNHINPILYLLLCCVVFSCAFSFREVSSKILKKNDISYGIYIYHMPIVNLFIYLGFTEAWFYLAAAGVSTILLAILSWVLIERPSMKLKSHPLNPLNKATFKT